MARKELSALNRPPRPRRERASRAAASLEAAPEAAATPSSADRRKGLSVENIARSFGKRQVVRNVSLHVNRGEVAGLLGPNGAGKTTCFYMITGLIPADSGAIWLDGEDITAQPMYQRARMGLGYLAQEASIFRGMTVEQNVQGGGGAATPSAKRRFPTRSAACWKSCTSIICATLRPPPCRAVNAAGSRSPAPWPESPSFMLLDEPFAGIDPLAIADIRQVIRYLADRGIGVLITDHNVRETLDIIDRASIIHGGEVLFEGTPGQIISDPEVRRVYLGDLYG